MKNITSFFNSDSDSIHGKELTDFCLDVLIFFPVILIHSSKNPY